MIGDYLWSERFSEHVKTSFDTIGDERYGYSLNIVFMQLDKLYTNIKLLSLSYIKLLSLSLHADTSLLSFEELKTNHGATF